MKAIDLTDSEQHEFKRLWEQASHDEYTPEKGITMTDTTKPRRPRAPRRNYERELRELALYCQIKADVLESTFMGEDNKLQAAQAAAYRDILARLQPRSAK